MNFFKSLPNESSVLYVHSSYDSVHIFTRNATMDVVMHYVLNKDLEVMHSNHLETDLNVKDVDFKGWYRPTVSTDESGLVFSGCLQVNDETYRFTVESGKLVLGDVIALSPRFKFESLKTLTNISIERHVQRGNFLYVTGVDVDYKEQVFLEVCMRTDKAVRRYNLRSDLGDLKVNTINLDSDKGKIYIAGEINTYDDQDRVVTTSPYLDILNFYR